MDTKKLRQKILDLAISGKLVPQDPNDEPASVLLERIKAEKERLIKEGKIKRSKKTAKASDTPHYGNVPFEVPNNWTWTTLGSVCNFENGFAFSSEDYKQEGTPLIRISNISDNTIDLNGCVFVQKEIDDKFLVKEGDLLIALSGATTGKMGIYSIDKTAYLNQRVGNLRIIDSSILCQEYRNIFMYSKTETILKLAYGGAQPNISGSVICSFLFPLPPLAEQQRIVTEVEHWFALIDQIEQGNVDLQTSIKQTKSKILDLAIHGKLVPQDPSDEPASELLKRINPKAEITCDNGQYRNIPKNWCACKLVDICSFLSRGKSPKYSEDDKTYPVFAQKCNLKDGGVSLEQARFLDPSTINKWNEVYKLQTGDILVNSTGTGTVGRTRLFNTNCLGNYPFVVPDSHVSVVRVLKSICPQYIYAYISSDSIQQYMEENLAGSTNQKELYIGVLENMQIFLPPLAEQQRIVARIGELFSTLDNIQKALEA